MNDWELIQKYCNGSESAFEALVKQHVDYVYCAALRQVRDPALAEDVSQAVFLLLAQKAKTFRPDTILISWLFRTTQNIAARAVRSELRRQRRESEAATMNPTTTPPESDPQWERVSPVLDEALAALPNKDRDAVLLRFIGRKQFSEVGAEIGASEDAAKKRVSRALGRLREFFLRRGTTLSVAALGVLLGEHVVHAAPMALPTKITAGVLSSGAASTSAVTLLKATLRDLFWNKVKWGAALGAGVVAVLSLGTAAMRQGSNREFAIATPTPAMESRPLSDSKTSAAGDATAPTNSAGHKLSLLIVRAENQQPISGAHVAADGAGGKGLKRVFDGYTDSKGAIDIQVPPQGATMNVYVAADGRVPIVMQWWDHEFNVPVLSHTVSLETGKTVSGTVLDEYGSPIPGAKVYFTGPGLDGDKRDNIGFDARLSGVLTDVNGRWTTTQFPPKGNAGFRVDSSAYTSFAAWPFNLPGYPTNIVTVLSNGVALTGRVTTTNGTPIADAQVWRQDSYWPTRTDANGNFSWPHINPGQTFIDIDADGFETAHDIVWATNAANESTFTLAPASHTDQSGAKANQPLVTLKGAVVDADTGKPIPSFRVRMGQAGFVNVQNEATMPNANLIGEGHDGQFEWQMKSRGNFRLQVEADGYLVGVSEQRGDTNANDAFIFKLHPISFVAGRVLMSDGSPAQNADVTLTGPNMGAMMQGPGKLMDANYPPGYANSRTQTDNEGNFRLAMKTDARGIAVIHESGTALVTFAAATNAPIVLEPWGAVEGTLYLNGRPAPDQTLSFGGTEKLDADPRVMFSFSYQTATDARGHFRFEKALSGTATITRFLGVATTGSAVVNPDHSVNVEVKSGAVTTVEMRRDGRPVIGHIVLQGATNDIDWGMSEGSLSGKIKYPFALSRDGALRADDVPPGTYTLSVALRLASANPLSDPLNPKFFGSLQKQVVIPPSENESRPVDLGIMTIMQTK
jgi:RNA polymerase sigma factor (sigma-70 family)